MANEHGGYRKPSRPAPVSGPGKMSKRTDSGPQGKRQLPDAAYGEQSAFQDIQSGAPMAGNPQAPPTPQGGSQAAAGAPVPVVPMDAPTQAPGMPVTAGADVGEGPGLAALGLIPRDQQLAAKDVERLKSHLVYLEWIANLPGASDGARDYVRQIKAMIP